MKRKNIERVLLFNPPARTLRNRVDINPLPPLGLAYLGASLESCGKKVRVVDCIIEGWKNDFDNKAWNVGENEEILVGLDEEGIKDIIRGFQPDLVGVSCMFTRQRKEAHRIIGFVAEIDPGIVCVMGGAHPTVMPLEVMKDANLDFIVLGEGEQSLCDLIALIEGKKVIGDLDGIGFRDGDNVRIIPKTSFIGNLDSLPFPAHHLIDLPRYFGVKSSHGTRRKKRFCPVITSRGCTFGCTFCSAHCVWGRKFRVRSVENVIEEMKMLKDKYGVEEIMIEDDNFNTDPRRAEQLMDQMIAENLGFVWDTPNGVSSISLPNNLIRKMKDSGCYKLNIAAESGNEHVLKNIMRKPVKLDDVRRQVTFARQIGLEVTLYLMIGMPGETEKQVWDTFRFAAEIGVFHPHISIATPYPGSKLYVECLKKGYISKSLDLDQLFIHTALIHSPTLSPEQVIRLRDEGWGYLLMREKLAHPLRFVGRKLGEAASHPLDFLSSLGSKLKNLRLLLKGFFSRS